MNDKVKKSNLKFSNNLIIGIFFLICFLLCFIIGENSNEYRLLYVFVMSYSILTIFYVNKYKKNIICIKTIFIGLFSIMIGLSPLFYYLNFGKLTANNGCSIIYQFAMILIAYISMLIGFKVNFSQNKNNSKKKSDSYILLFSVVLNCIALLFNVIYFIKNKSFLMNGNLGAGRIMAQSGNGILILLSSLDLPGIGLLYKYNQNTHKKKYLLIFFVIVSFVFSIIRGSRTKLVRCLILLLLMYNSKNRIKPKSMLKFCVFAIIGLTFLQMIRTNMSNGNIDFFSSIYNILDVGSINLNYVYDIFPKKMPFQYGYTYLINLIMMLPGEGIDFTLWLKKIIGIDFAGGGVTPTIIGESYMNFGYIGIIFVMFFMGIIGNILDKKYENTTSDKFWVSYFIVIIIDVFRGGIANIEVSLFTYITLYIFYQVMYKNKKYGDEDLIE